MRNSLLNIVSITIFFGISACGREPEPSAAERQPAPSRLSALLGEDAAAVFPLVTEPRRFVFPQDHGPHPEFRNEWWYVTGNLDAAGGERFGFELTLFRFALAPASTPSTSRWRGRQLYMGHVAVTDVARDRFIAHERLSRGSLDLAGASAEPLRIWLEDWELSGGPDGAGFRLRAAAGDIALDLALEPRKRPVLNGVDGLSQKSADAGNASYYYSMTRLSTSGVLEVDGERFEVSGSSWLDREWGSSALAPDQLGWDWFALQFDDGTELMYYQIRQRDGAADPSSAGTFVATDGTARPLARDEVGIEVLDHWSSPNGGRYPIRWRLTVPSQGLAVEVVPVMANQELLTSVRYWEGAVDVAGEKAGQGLRGRGYVEMTGYADSVAAAD